MKKLAIVLMLFLLSGCGVTIGSTDSPMPVHHRVWWGPWYSYGYPGYYYRPAPVYRIYPHREHPPLFRSPLRPGNRQ